MSEALLFFHPSVHQVFNIVWAYIGPHSDQEEFTLQTERIIICLFDVHLSSRLFDVYLDLSRVCLKKAMVYVYRQGSGSSRK